MVAQIVRFKSGLSDEQVQQTYEERAARYRAQKGLIQKYYPKFPETGEHGAVYIWESAAALKDFSESHLRRTISMAYEVEGTPQVYTAEVVMALHTRAEAARGQ